MTAAPLQAKCRLYHLSANRIFLNTVKVSDPIAWTMDYLQGNLTSLVRIAGYGRLADGLDEAALSAALPGVEKALRDSAPRV